MQKVLEYDIASFNDSTSLMADVQAYISQGWQPFGGPFVEDGEYGKHYCQAVVRYEEEEPQNGNPN